MAESKATIHICIICEGYPSEYESVYTFVDRLVCEMVDQGLRCTVVAPQSLTKSLLKRRKLIPCHVYKKTKRGNVFDVYRPHTMSFSNIRLFGINLSHFFFKRTINNCLEKINIHPDVIYGHFWHTAITAYRYANHERIPLFVATGESQIRVQDLYSRKRLEKFCDYVRGVICVSQKNEEESIRLGLVEKSKCIVVPNAIDKDLFFPISKNDARKALGYSSDDFIIVFTGSFTHRKGVLRLSKAINQLNEKDIKSIFIGKGQDKPDCDGILFCGELPHNKIVHYLNCADVFVLPTLKEGCCNAILEAMACGLPIISSDLSFNDDILSPEYSIRINSNNVDEIMRAVRFLYGHPEKCREMGRNAFKAVQKFTIENRASRIIEYIENNINK